MLQHRCPTNKLAKPWEFPAWDTQRAISLVRAKAADLGSPGVGLTHQLPPPLEAFSGRAAHQQLLGPLAGQQETDQSQVGVLAADSEEDPIVEPLRADIVAQRQIIAELQQQIDPCMSRK